MMSSDCFQKETLYPDRAGRFGWKAVWLPGLVVFLILSSLLFPLYSNEVDAYRLDKDAEYLERLAEKSQSPEEKAEYRELAKRKRESAIQARKNHYLPPQPYIENPKEITEMDRPFPIPEKKFVDGIWEFSLGYGSGYLNASPGGEYIQDPFLATALGTDFVPRNPLAYDNIFYLNSAENTRRFTIHPFHFKLNFFSEDYKFGFGLEDRGIVFDSSYNAWSSTNPLNRFNAQLNGEFRWNETKFNFFYREDLDYDKTITMIWGARLQSAILSESAVLPLAPGYYEYNENSYSVGPNIGMNYSQNFLGAFVFTAGIELSIGGGGLQYDRTFFLEGNSRVSDYFSRVEMDKPIQLQTLGGEFYTKYDFLINDTNRLGVSLIYHHFQRNTKSERLPLIYTNRPEFYPFEYQEFFARTLVYNFDRDSGNSRYQIFRWISLEYTYVF